MAKAVMPFAAFREKYGSLDGPEISEKILELAMQFLKEHQAPERRKDSVKIL
jgi:hypothetical protein